MRRSSPPWSTSACKRCGPQPSTLEAHAGTKQHTGTPWQAGSLTYRHSVRCKHCSVVLLLGLALGPSGSLVGAHGKTISSVPSGQHQRVFKTPTHMSRFNFNCVSPGPSNLDELNIWLSLFLSVGALASFLSAATFTGSARNRSAGQATTGLTAKKGFESAVALLPLVNTALMQGLQPASFVTRTLASTFDRYHCCTTRCLMSLVVKAAPPAASSASSTEASTILGREARHASYLHASKHTLCWSMRPNSGFKANECRLEPHQNNTYSAGVILLGVGSCSPPPEDPFHAFNRSTNHVSMRKAHPCSSCCAAHM